MSSSYQNGGHRAVVMGDPSSQAVTQAHVKPMAYLEKRRRRNRCISLSLLAFFMAMIGCIAAWRYKHHLDVVKAIKASKNSNGGDDDDISWDDDEVSKGLIKLNVHLNQQSKIIAEGCESTLLLMRHCEKYGPTVVDDSGNTHCSYVGHERAHFIRTLFGESLRWPAPSRMYALTPERDGHLNFREYETLRPLSLKTGIAIEMADQTNLVSKYFDLLKTGQMCGKLTVVSWKHSYIPEMAEMLGCTVDDGCPKEYPEDSFDQVWQLKYVFHPSTDLDRDEEEEEFLHNNINNDDKTGRRKLQTANSSKKHVGWRVFGTVGQQGFDPLSFSYKAGDYPEGGAASGGSWMKDL